MQLGRFRIISGYASRIVVDTKANVVWRYAFGAGREGIRQNYGWLRKSQGIVPAPVPILVKRIGPLLATCEEYIPGRRLNAADITPSAAQDVLRMVVPLYREYGLPEERIYKTLIHGDLTFRNILCGTQTLFCIDGDRSTMAPPEFDVWLLVADAEIHKKGSASHKKFLQYLWNSAPSDELFRVATEALYECLPDARTNKKYWGTIWTSFLTRCLAHSVRDCMRRGKSIAFLDEL